MKTKNDRLNEMAGIISMMVNENDFLEFDFKDFIIDHAHMFNLRKKDIVINDDICYLVKTIDNLGHFIKWVKGDTYLILI